MDEIGKESSKVKKKTKQLAVKEVKEPVVRESPRAAMAVSQEF